MGNNSLQTNRDTLRDGFVVKQGLVCAICKRLFAEWLNPVLDHCHKTDRCRGALCSACNSGLGMFKDDLKLLFAAMEYLSKDHSGNPFYPGSEEGRAEQLITEIEEDMVDWQEELDEDSVA